MPLRYVIGCMSRNGNGGIHELDEDGQLLDLVFVAVK